MSGGVFVLLTVAFSFVGGDGIEPVRQVDTLKVFSPYPNLESCEGDKRIWKDKNTGIAACVWSAK